MKVIGWDSSVNKKIIDQTGMEIGVDGLIEDQDKSGWSEMRPTSLCVPDVFQVVMDFDWAEKDENGFSEYDRFVNWYKFKHQRGAFPFSFPSITKFGYNKDSPFSLYKITSSLKPTKSGYSYRVSMTWKEVFSGEIDIPFVNPDISSIFVKNGQVNVIYTEKPDTEPVPSTDSKNFSAINPYISFRRKDGISFSILPITSIKQNGNEVIFYFSAFESGIYFVKVNNLEPYVLEVK
jgi:hypothetical protein